MRRTHANRVPMSRGAFDLPPLELLVAFESAARHLSFTRAGEEIALTQSAVSRQIQALEGSVSASRCSGACIAPWRSPRRVAPSTRPTTEALGRLDRATRDDPRDSERARTVVVTTTRRLRRPLADPAARVASSAAHPERRRPHLRPATRSSTSSATASTSPSAIAPSTRGAAGADAAVRRDRLAGVQPAPARGRRFAALAVPGRPRRPHAAAHGARRQQPAAGLGALAAGHEARRSAPGRRAPLLVVRPADPGRDRGAGRRPRPQCR